jgi:hypothetical protein
VKWILTILIVSFCIAPSIAQQSEPEPASELYPNQLEESAEDEEGESENDYDAQQLAYFIKHPLDINGSDLDQLPLIGPLLVSNLTAYRKLLGDLIDLHELQAVPGFTIEIIKSILPYVTIKKDISISDFRERFSKGEHMILLRPTFTPEKAGGFLQYASQKFIGSRPAFYIRYKYKFKNLLQYGFAADKDAGEKFLQNHLMPDFISFHFFMRKIGLFRAIALGDYTINMGQGLIHWQSQAFRKSSSVLNIKRQNEVLRPYQSAGEYNFHRGIAATISIRSSEFSFFVSRKYLTANVEDNVITSINTSGLHRTPGELNDKNVASLITAGFVLKQKFTNGHISLNGVYYLYSLPLLKKDELYNLYSIKGREWRNSSADYSYTFRNFHFFGEVATDRNQRFALIDGVMSSLSKSVDAAIIHRHIGKSYQSVFGNAFTENTMPANEHGFYSGLSLKPHINWRIDLYADLFAFPWLKYRLDAPSAGCAYLIQLTWKPDRKSEIYTRFRFRMKPLNINDEDELSVPGLQTIQHWRTHLNHQLTRTILLRSRVELCVFSHEFAPGPAYGYLFYTDVLYRPMRSWLSGNVRFQAFEAENYDTRIYAYENDLLFVSSTPSFYNNGVRCYLNIKGKLKVKMLCNSLLTINLKLATTVYNNTSNIGTGPASIPGNRISAVKLQIFLNR